MSALAQGQKLENFSNQIANKSLRYADVAEMYSVTKADVAAAKKLFTEEVKIATEAKDNIKLEEWQKRLTAITRLESDWIAQRTEIELSKEENHQATVDKARAKLKELFGDVSQNQAMKPAAVAASAPAELASAAKQEAAASAAGAAGVKPETGAAGVRPETNPVVGGAGAAKPAKKPTLRKLNYAQSREVTKKNLDQGLVDATTNSGLQDLLETMLEDDSSNEEVVKATKEAQKIIGTGIDGTFGKKSVAALNKFNAASAAGAPAVAKPEAGASAARAPAVDEGLSTMAKLGLGAAGIGTIYLGRKQI